MLIVYSMFQHNYVVHTLILIKKVKFYHIRNIIFVYINHKAIAASTSTDSTKCSGKVSGLPIVITMGAIICIQIILCLMTPFITIFIYQKCKFILAIQTNLLVLS